MAQTYQMKHNPQGTIYSLLTVESDGQMTMTFHGTDRELSQEATLTEDGRIATGGSLFPGLESGRWQAVDDVIVVGPRKPRVERQPSDISHQTSSIDHQPSAIDSQTSDTLKAIGMVAAATVALLVIYETGLLIPMGLIGIATGGLLK